MSAFDDNAGDVPHRAPRFPIYIEAGIPNAAKRSGTRVALHVCKIDLVRLNALMDKRATFINAKSAFLDKPKRVFD